MNRVLVLACTVVGFVAIFLGAVGAPAGALSVALRGEGETWPLPAIQQLELDGGPTAAPFVPTYSGGVGEEAARHDLATGLIDYAVTGTPLTTDETATATQNGRTVAYVPYAAGGVAIVADVPGCGQQALNLTVATLVKIFTGAIPDWNSNEIFTENPSLHLDVCVSAQQPRITRVVRIDSSASTAALISLFLSDSNARSVWNAYAQQTGAPVDTPVDRWPTEESNTIRELDSGSSGVLDALAFNSDSNQAGGITYVAPAWAMQFGDLTCALQTTRQSQSDPTKFVLPTPAAVASGMNAALTTDQTTGVRLDLSKITATSSYPAPMLSYLAVPITGLRASPPSGPTQDKASALGNFVHYILGPSGQADIAATDYVPVPAAVIANGELVAQQVADQAPTGAGTTTTTVPSSSTTSTTSKPGTTSTTTTGHSTTTTSATAAHSGPPTTAGGALSAGNSLSGGGTSGAGASPAPASSPNDAGASLPFTGGPRPLLLIGGALLLVAGQVGRGWSRRSPA